MYRHCNDVILYFSVVILSGGDNNADFRGFLIQGRLMADDTAIGTFLDNGEDQQLACDGNVSFINTYYNYKST